MNLVAPKAQLTHRGKTAQTGRIHIQEETLPKIDNGYVRSPSNGHHGIQKINNLFDNKGTRYGNLLTKDKTNTIDILGEKKTESDFMKNKNYADIRLKIGKKKIPD